MMHSQACDGGVAISSMNAACGASGDADVGFASAVDARTRFISLLESSLKA
jgi:hypothetical protein